MTTLTMLDIFQTVLASGSLITLIIFLIQRRDTKKDNYQKLCEKIEELQTAMEDKDGDLEKELKKLEKDIIRTQLLQLMIHYQPEEEHELMQVAQHYFVDLKANWYLTPRFNRFLKKQGIAKPEWLQK